jgi:hypothetical protein
MPHYAAHVTEPWQSMDAVQMLEAEEPWVRRSCGRTSPKMAGSPRAATPGATAPASREMVILVVLRDTGRGDFARRLASSENRCRVAGGGGGTGPRPSYT